MLGLASVIDFNVDLLNSRDWIAYCYWKCRWTSIFSIESISLNFGDDNLINEKWDETPYSICLTEYWTRKKRHFSEVQKKFEYNNKKSISLLSNCMQFQLVSKQNIQDQSNEFIFYVIETSYCVFSA